MDLDSDFSVGEGLSQPRGLSIRAGGIDKKAQRTRAAGEYHYQ
jgi:hypothetical protein